LDLLEGSFKLIYKDGAGWPQQTDNSLSGKLNP
jgi:hypothetical protein